MEEQFMEFEFEKETKNAIRYKEAGDVPGIGTLYIQKHYLKARFGEFPEKVMVEVSVKG